LFLISAVTLWIIIIVFSLIGPVPINDQVKAWELAQLPEDWKAKRRRWDVQKEVLQVCSRDEGRARRLEI